MIASIENLNEDLVAEILHRLTYKESRRCLCVCKTWSLIVSQPSFLKKLMTFHGPKNQVQQQPYAIVNIIGCQDFNTKNELKGCTCYSHDEDNNPPVVVFDRSLDFLPKREGEEIEVLRVSGDLFLCRHSKKSGSRPMRAHHLGGSISGGDEEDYYYVCNPITRQWVSLPPRARGHGSNIQFYSGQFYEEDPTTSSSIYRPEYEYVVLAMVDEAPTHHSLSSINVEFFSSKAGIWRTLSLSAPQGFVFSHEFWLQESCLHEGVLWYCNGIQLLRYNINKDLRRQEPMLFNLPHDYIVPDVLAIYIGVCCGRFHLVGHFEEEDDDEENVTIPSYLMVWELDEEEEEEEGRGGKWRLMHKICATDIGILYLSLHPGHPDIIFFELCHRLVECNPRTKDFKYKKKAATRYTISNRSKSQIFFIPPLYPTPVLPLKNMQEENRFFDPPVLPVVTSIWEQVDFLGEFRKKLQVV